MFEPASRYHDLETAIISDRSGRMVAYKRRRFLPEGRSMPLLVAVSVEGGDRLDLISARTLGDPEQFWRICDANDAMDPEELIQLGRTLRVPVPQA